MDPLARLCEIAGSAPARPFESCLPPSVLLYERSFTGADGVPRADDYRTRHRITVAGGHCRAEYAANRADAEPEMVAVAGPRGVFRLGGSAGPNGVTNSRTPNVRLPVAAFTARDHPDYESQRQATISTYAAPVLATHHGLSSAHSAHEMIGFLAAGLDPAWAVRSVRDEERAGRPCTCVEATEWDGTASRWWFDRDHGVLIAAEKEVIPGDLALAYRAEFDFADPARPVCTKFVTGQVWRGKSLGETTLKLVEIEPWRGDAEWFTPLAFYVEEPETAAAPAPALPAVRLELAIGVGLVLVAVALVAAVYFWLGRTRR